MLCRASCVAQGLVGIRMRAMAAAILLFVLNIIGMGLGPLFVGSLSDHIAASSTHGNDSLRYALCAATFIILGATIASVLAARTLRADLASAAGAR